MTDVEEGTSEFVVDAIVDGEPSVENEVVVAVFGFDAVKCGRGEAPTHSTARISSSMLVGDVAKLGSAGMLDRDALTSPLAWC